MYWTNYEIEFLKNNYTLLDKYKLIKELSNRRWSAITRFANKMGLKRKGIYSKAYSCEKLLEDTPESFYWMGFLIADSHISIKNNRIELSLAEQDLEHLYKYSKFINYRNNIKLKKPGKKNLKIFIELIFRLQLLVI